MRILLFFLLLQPVFWILPDLISAAQSSADNPVTAEILEKARQKVLGISRTAMSAEDEYVVGQGDIISVQVYGEGDMSVTAPATGRGETSTDGLRASSGGVMVRIDGRISLKHIGDIDAVDYTLTQLADYLKEIYSSVYDDPVVTVVLLQSNSQRYTLMGKVAEPGIYYLDYPINLVQVIARSGGFTEWAKSEITVIRKGVNRNSILFKGNKLSFDYNDFLDGKRLERNIFIKAGDIIVVH